jgi:succinate dehydrogenase/fumarate reductase flavoprotein subunit
MLQDHLDQRGPLRIQMGHLPEDKILEIEDLLFTTERPSSERFYKGRGIDFRSGEIELWPTETFLCGGHGLTGVRVNEYAETGVPGLYAAGDTSLVARGHLSGAFVFGEIAAESASAYATEAPATQIDTDQVAAFLAAKKSRLAQSGNPVPVEEFEFKVRRMINDYIRPPKHEYKLDRALWWMDRFRHELGTLVHVGDIHDLFKVYEVENIIQCATMSALASKARKESRWGPWHYRSDYPEPDDANWIKHVVLTQGTEPADIQVGFKDIIKRKGEDR